MAHRPNPYTSSFPYTRGDVSSELRNGLRVISAQLDYIARRLDGEDREPDEEPGAPWG